MNVQIALSPQLNITPDEFTNAWNSSSETRQVARATVHMQTRGFDPTGGAGFVLLEGIVIGLMTNALWDLIKELLFREGVRKTTEYMEIPQPDGTTIIVVKIVEE